MMPDCLVARYGQYQLFNCRDIDVTLMHVQALYTPYNKILVFTWRDEIWNAGEPALLTLNYVQYGFISLIDSIPY